MPLISPSYQHKYRQLLLVLLGQFLFSPLLKGWLGGVLSSAILLYSIVLIVKSFPLSRRLFFVFVAIAALAFCLETIARVFLVDVFGVAIAFALTLEITYAAYIGMAVWFMMREILFASRVSMDLVRGGICVYLLLGYLWAMFYSILLTLEPNAFSISFSGLDNTFARLLYFSFTTLTTLGYGDIVPRSELAQVLTNFQAITGQMYPAIFISILVGGYLSQQHRQ